MSKQSIARKGMRFVGAHNARVLRHPAVKAARKALEAARAAKDTALIRFGFGSPEWLKAWDYMKTRDAAYAASRRKLGYITLSDRVLIAVFGAK